MGAVLALDPGERRTGIAVSDPDRLLASPVATHDRRRDGSLLELVARLCAERDVELVLVGHPLTQAGERGDSARRSERLAERLRRRLAPSGVEVRLVDERYSSVEAGRILAGRGREKGARDAVAAALVLEAYLDSQRPGGSGA